MAFTSEDLEQIIEAVAKEGFRIQIATEEYSTLRTQVLEKGELVYLKDLGEIRIGNGISEVASLPSLKMLTQIKRDALASPIAREIWRDLQALSVRSEVKNLLMPEEILREFIDQKPENFSFMKGENLTKKSFLSQYWQTTPDTRGCFLRNLDQGARRDESGRKIGMYQEDAMQKIEGKFNNVYMARPYSDKTSGAFKHIVPQIANIGILTRTNEYWDNFVPISFDSSRVARSSSETRPKNISVIMVWRLY